MELLKTLFENAELPADFKEKTSTLFEAAVDEKVKAELATLTEAYEAKLAEAQEKFVAEATASVDAVIEETVLEWAKENAVAIDSEVKGQIAESFLSGLKGLFEKADIELTGDTAGKELIKLQEQATAAEKAAAEAKAALVEAQAQLTQIKVKEIIESATEGLAETQIHRVQKLCEAFEFKSAEDFQSKVALVVEAVGGKIVAVNDNGSSPQAVPAGGSQVSNKVDAAGVENEDGELVKKPAGAANTSAEGDKGTPEKTVPNDPLKESVDNLKAQYAPHIDSDMVAETLKLFK